MNEYYIKLRKRVHSFLKRRVMRAPLSVIVPIYNSEETIGRCLDSLLNQSQRRIKIICVNDGSTDGTLEILRRYRTISSKIRIIDQANKGRAAARNAGLDVVKTKYVMFCDSDDYFEPQMCENMLDVMDKNEVDLAVCGIKMIYEAHEEMSQSDEEYYRLKYDGIKVVDEKVIMDTDDSVCNKIFMMDIIRDKKIRFPDGLNNEDYYFSNAYMSVSRRVFFLKQKLYNYVRHEGSIMSEDFECHKQSLDHLDVANKLFEFYKRNDFLNHKNLFWRQWISCFWYSHRYSSKEIKGTLKKESMKFIDKNYERYKPDDPELLKWMDDVKKAINKIKVEEKNGKK